jgi:polysaccharide biosynthesis/export protein
VFDDLSRRMPKAARARAQQHFRRLLVLVLLAVNAAACASTGAFVWFRDLPRTESAPPSGEYVVGIGDALSVHVYEQPSLTIEGKIRPDGRIALPFIGEVVAVGKTPTALAKEIETRLTQFIVAPRVTVNVTATAPVVISVLGEVGHQGVITLEPSNGLSLLQALAQAGGPSDFADKSRIFVLRRAPTYQRIRFKYDALLQNSDGSATFALQTGDVVVVE